MALVVRKFAAHVCMVAVDNLLGVAEWLDPTPEDEVVSRTVELGAYFDVIDIGEVNVVVSRN